VPSALPPHVAFHADASRPPPTPMRLVTCCRAFRITCNSVVTFFALSLSCCCFFQRPVPFPLKSKSAHLSHTGVLHTQIDVVPASLAAQAATTCAAATWAEHVQRRYLPSSATSPSREGLPYSLLDDRMSFFSLGLLLENKKIGVVFFLRIEKNVDGKLR